MRCTASFSLNDFKLFIFQGATGQPGDIGPRGYPGVMVRLSPFRHLFIRETCHFSCCYCLVLSIYRVKREHKVTMVVLDQRENRYISSTICMNLAIGWSLTDQLNCLMKFTDMHIPFSFLTVFTSELNSAKFTHSFDISCIHSIYIYTLDRFCIR